MRILAIDSSALVASVAIVEEDDRKDVKVLAEYTINYKKTHSQTLLPMLDEVVKMTEFDLSSLDAIAVAGGPGSFTGLRIGAATAKGLGLALNKPLINIPTLEGMAYNLCYSDRLVCPIMDARRNQVYTGIYRFRDEKMEIVEGQMAVGIEELAEKLKKYDEPVVFLGDGVPVFREKLSNELLKDRDITFAPAHRRYQSAASVGTLAMEYFREGRVEDAAEMKPDYLRLSQAERERAEKEKQKENHSEEGK